MRRRSFLYGGLGAGLTSLACQGRALAQMMGTDSDPAALGYKKLGTVLSTPEGRLISMDSLLFMDDDRITTNDVVVAGSYCGAATLPHATRKGVKAVIAHDAGIGKDEAGVSALAAGDEHGMPVVAVAGMSASISNGNSMALGTISRANRLARELGVKPGQSITEAGALLLKAPAGKPNALAIPFDKKVYEMDRVGEGRIFASSALTNLPPGQDYSKDVIAWGAHSGAVVEDLMAKWRVKGWIGNDAGMAKNNTGIGGLPPSNALGIAAAAVSTMSARIGDGMSTYSEGVISAVNDVASAKGVRVGMKTPEALRLMIR
ncbi:hypothetical protein [Cupriavidus oxalaticus]|jgi:hypothetical protein|nr:hypothetical protein [Cupriavidus oxalaticus]QRQ85949.1 hypothetical protein JTE91_22180 [Cupriavidus oxalaticus]QRQ95725.1 hypothetical protein JTE92_20080 [Cupriavidus oxalaticus]WQD84394.1 hypothetical protein U0036_07800 [Cupriavidus oxalaticus]